MKQQEQQKEKTEKRIEYMLTLQEVGWIDMKNESSTSQHKHAY
jgi:hypothetical protein